MPDPTRFSRLAQYVFDRHFIEYGFGVLGRNDIVQGGLLRLTRDMRRRPDADWDKLAYQCLYRGMQDEFTRADHLARRHRAEVRNGVGEPAPEFVTIDEIDQHGNVKERDVSEVVSELQEASILWCTVATLPERQRQLIIGLLDERKQKDVAAEIGVTESRFCQLKNKTFSALRVRLTARGIHR